MCNLNLKISKVHHKLSNSQLTNKISKRFNINFPNIQLTNKDFTDSQHKFFKNSADK